MAEARAPVVANGFSTAEQCPPKAIGGAVCRWSDAIRGRACAHRLRGTAPGEGETTLNGRASATPCRGFGRKRPPLFAKNNAGCLRRNLPVVYA